MRHRRRSSQQTHEQQTNQPRLFASPTTRARVITIRTRKGILVRRNMLLEMQAGLSRHSSPTQREAITATGIGRLVIWVMCMRTTTWELMSAGGQLAHTPASFSQWGRRIRRHGRPQASKAQDVQLLPTQPRKRAHTQRQEPVQPSRPNMATAPLFLTHTRTHSTTTNNNEKANRTLRQSNNCAPKEAGVGWKDRWARLARLPRMAALVALEIRGRA